MIGYKAFNKNLVSKNGFKYEIGKEYEIDEEPVLFKKGFHFYASIADCYNLFGHRMDNNTRICEIEALGSIATNDTSKVLSLNSITEYCTNKIRIIREITDENLRKANSSSKCTGYKNSGFANSGNANTGKCNSGNCNSGDYNSGFKNSGCNNSGDYNSGIYNSGDYNSGPMNIGNNNSGQMNTGNCNTGNLNSGDYNTGEWNVGNYASGVFNTDKNPKIKMFDKESDWTVYQWNTSPQRKILSTCPVSLSVFVHGAEMSGEEIERHPEYNTIGGYIKPVIVSDTERQMWWDKLPDHHKELILSLPNFDKEIFKQCTGIDVDDSCIKIYDNDNKINDESIKHQSILKKICSHIKQLLRGNK